MQITVRNWNEDYVTRKDIKNPSWFALPVKFFTDADWMNSFTGDSVAVLAYVCAQATKNKGVMKVNPAHAEAWSGLSGERFREGVAVLESLQLVHVDVRDPYVPRTSTCLTQDRTGQDNTGPTRTESVREEPAQAQAALPIPEVESAPEERKLDYDHDSVNTKPKETELPRLALIWNLRAHKSLARVRFCSESRRKKTLKVWKAHAQEEFWVEVIERMNLSKFCLGTAKEDQTWKADFDFLIKPDTAAKVLEGKYDGKTGPGGTNPSTKSFWARQQEAKNNGQ